MSGPTGDRSISPEEEAAVSRILADAAVPLPVPADVALRLDDVLGDLVAERADDVDDRPVPAPPSDDPAQRRRWPRLLLAAAAVVVVGYGVVSVTGDGSLSGSADQSAQSDATRAEAGGSADSMTPGRTPSSAAADSSSGGTGRQYDAQPRRSVEPAPEGGASGSLGRFPPRLRSERLDVGVRRALRYLDADATGGLLLDDVEGAQCDTPDLAPGERFLPVLYDGRAAALVARTADSGVIEVTVWSCSGARLDRTTIEP